MKVGGEACRAQPATETKAALEVEYRVGLYHDVVERGDAQTSRSRLMRACGGTIRAIGCGDWNGWWWRRSALVVASYSLREAESDEDALRESLSSCTRVVWEWEAEKNASRSVEVRELGFDGQCILRTKTLNL